MKKIILVVALLICLGKSQAQWNINLSMGLDVKSASSFKDYVNYVMASKQVASFKTAVSFTGGIDYLVDNNFALGIEYNLQIDSYNVPSSNGIGGEYKISYSFHRPSLLAYYIIPGDGYQFKFGGGVGYRYASLEQQLMDTQNYTASGFGLLGRAIGNTSLAKNLYALIGVDVRYDLPGELSNSSGTISNPATRSKVNLNMFSIGIFLGLTYKI